MSIREWREDAEAEMAFARSERERAALVAMIPRMRAALTTARIALTKPYDDVQCMALEILQKLDDELARLP